MQGSLKVAVIGCGSGGPAAGVFLSRAGHEVTLFERVPELKPVGAGFLLQPSGLSVLQKLGCLDDILRFGSPVERLYGHTPWGRAILNLPYNDLEQGLYGVGLHRASLLHVLCQQMEQAGVHLQLGTEIATLQQQGSHKSLLTDQQGQSYGPFDLVIVADGSRSSLREQLGISCRVSAYNWGAIWYIGEDKDAQFRKELYQVFESTTKLIGFLPTGYTPGHTDEPLVSMFWSLQLNQYDAWKQRGLKAWKEEVLRLVPRSEAFLSQITEPEQLIRASYYDVVMKRWSTDRAVVIGDAAHAMSPQLGQGVNLALFDAMVLAECLEQHYTVGEALQAYNHRRKRHLRFYQFATRWATPFFQSSFWPLGLVRDWVFPYGLYVRPWRVQMIRAMAGLKRGILRLSMPLKGLHLKQLPSPTEEGKPQPMS